MSKSVVLREPRWQTIPARVLLLTFIGTLLVFAVSLLLGIMGTVVAGLVRGTRPEMTGAYRHIALPAAAVAGGVILLLALGVEIRHYRQAKTLAAIERVS